MNLYVDAPVWPGGMDHDLFHQLANPSNGLGPVVRVGRLNGGFEVPDALAVALGGVGVQFDRRRCYLCDRALQLLTPRFEFGKALLERSACRAFQQQVDRLLDVGFHASELLAQFAATLGGRVAEPAPRAMKFPHVFGDQVGRGQMLLDTLKHARLDRGQSDRATVLAQSGLDHSRTAQKSAALVAA